ncbi:hypothetical protein OG563_18030 [Nocardia vinacea]|uniref:Uncharacterized protein n=1 Tax=Nocardia vinacea TaxID=96468 RepID=A0ABZ1Z321_9NOCA|nr:hypothetical protein [Nocardia vinacea]
MLRQAGATAARSRPARTDRIRPLLTTPRKEVTRIAEILNREFTRLYRKRNLIVHGGHTHPHHQPARGHRDNVTADWRSDLGLLHVEEAQGRSGFDITAAVTPTKAHNDFNYD